MENTIDRNKSNAADLCVWTVVIKWQPNFQNVAIDPPLTNPAVSEPNLVIAAIKPKQILHIKIIVGF